MESGAYDSLDDEMKQRVDYKAQLAMDRIVQGYYDFCILYSEEDQEGALQYRRELRETFDLHGAMDCDPEFVKVWEDMERIDEMVKRSSYTLLYVSAEFNKEPLLKRQKNDLLFRYQHKPNLIPVYNVEDYESLTPVGLGGITKIERFRDDGDAAKINSIFTIEKRKERQWKSDEEKKRLQFEEMELKENLAAKILEENHLFEASPRRYTRSVSDLTASQRTATEKDIGTHRSLSSVNDGSSQMVESDDEVISSERGSEFAQTSLSFEDGLPHRVEPDGEEISSEESNLYTFNDMKKNLA